MSALGDSLKARAAALLGVSGYQRPERHGEYGPELDDKIVETIREALGGQLQSIPETRLRWYLKDLEIAQYQADAGNLTLVGQLWRTMRRDGYLRGLLGTRTAGLVGLPRIWSGNLAMARRLSVATDGTRPLFDDMCPPAELTLMTADGIGLGTSVSELVPVPGRSFPVMIRLDPEFLLYRWDKNMWFFSSIAGLLPITPGDGHWVLHQPGGRLAPWNSGLWHALGRAFINKEHALFHRANYSAKLANPARVAQAPLGSTDAQQQSWFRKVMAWGTNTVFGLMPGYEVKLLESNGRGYEVFQAEIDTSNAEMTVALVGQLVSTTGGTGFSSQELPLQSLAELHKETGDAVAYTLNTQVLPPWVAGEYGIAAINSGPILGYDTKKPKDRKAVADGWNALGSSLGPLDDAMTRHGRQIDIDAVANDFGLPLLSAPERDKANADGRPMLEEAKSLALKGAPISENLSKTEMQALAAGAGKYRSMRAA